MSTFSTKLSSYHVIFFLCTSILHQANSFKPSMFTSCYICQKLCMNLGLCGQTLVFHLRTTMVIYETCFMEPRMWMARCVHLHVPVNKDYPERKCRAIVYVLVCFYNVLTSRRYIYWTTKKTCNLPVKSKLQYPPLPGHTLGI